MKSNVDKQHHITHHTDVETTESVDSSDWNRADQTKQCKCDDINVFARKKLLKMAVLQSNKSTQYNAVKNILNKFRPWRMINGYK